MRLWIFSDLHRDVMEAWDPPAIPEADAAVIAGDIGEGLERSIDWLAAEVRPHMPVVLVAGNHEFYRTYLRVELARGERRARQLGIALLANSETTIAGVRFLGGTLWTDYELRQPGEPESSMQLALQFMNDHRNIGWGGRDRQAFRPEHARALHLETRAFIGAALGERHRGKTVVVTHHAPHPGSVHPRFAASNNNAAFVSDLSGLIAAGRPELWVHGHTHASLDYEVGRTRIVCNPKGYGRENGDFDPGLIVVV